MRVSGGYSFRWGLNDSFGFISPPSLPGIPGMPVIAAPVSAWGFRPINPEYAGPLLRQFDNAGNHTDIGFFDGEFDQPASQTAITAGQDKGTVFYDQYGTENEIQATYGIAPTVILDATPSHLPALRFADNTSFMVTADTALGDIWAGGGCCIAGMRYRSGSGTGILVFGFADYDASFTFPVPTGDDAHMAIEIYYNSDAPGSNVPTVIINGAPVMVTTVQFGVGAKTPGAFALGASAVDIWECQLWRNVQP